MNQNFYELEREVVDHPNKTSFFKRFMRDLSPEIALSAIAGYLQPDRNDKSEFKGWRGTIDHQMVVALGCIALGEIISLPRNEIAHLMQNGATHDADQKFERMKLKRHKYEEQIYDNIYLALPDRNHDGIIGLDWELQGATKPTFLSELDAGRTTLLQRCLFYVDDLTKVSHITPLENRIAEARARDIKKNGVETNDWSKELRLANKVEEDLAILASDSGQKIENHDELPSLILKNILIKFNSINNYFANNPVCQYSSEEKQGLKYYKNVFATV